jgi:hypothetical protein
MTRTDPIPKYRDHTDPRIVEFCVCVCNQINADNLFLIIAKAINMFLIKHLVFDQQSLFFVRKVYENSTG